VLSRISSAEAAAADHVIYGWVFFSVVILLLIAIGLPFRQDLDRRPPPTEFAEDEDPERADFATLLEYVSEMPGIERVHQRVGVDDQFDHRIELHALGGQHLRQRLGLRHGAREPIENKATRGVRLVQTATQHTDQDVVGDQLTSLHDRLGFVANG